MSLARQQRTCPPLSVAQLPEHAELLEQHRNICPFCQDDSIDEWAAVADIASRIFDQVSPLSKSAVDSLTIGQIRYIKMEKAIWREAYYYKPPMVLVLNTIEAPGDAIRVAQIYDDDLLAGTGDLILREDRTDGAGELFVECWNTYTLRTSWLGSLVGCVSGDVLDAVKRLETDPGDLPPWGILPWPMRDDDPRIAFRELEVEVAYTFSSRASGELLAAHEEAALRNELADLVPHIHLPPGAADALTLLASARLPDEMLPLAAADSEAKIVFGNRVFLDEDQLVDVKPVKVYILGVHRREDHLVVFEGRVADDGFPTPERTVFRLLSDDETLIVPKQDDFDNDSGGFMVTFSTTSVDWRNLRVAIIHERQ